MRQKAEIRRIEIRREAAQIDRIKRGFERKLESRLKRLFIRQLRAAAKGYEAGDAEASMTGFSQELDAVMRPHYEEVVNTFGQRVLEQRGIKYDFTALSAQYLRERGARNVVEIDAYTKKRVAQTIALGVENNASRRQISKDIEALGQEFSARRSAVIARTETHNASSWANHEMNKEFMPVDSVKQWVATNDPRTRSHHSAMNGVQVGIDDEFKMPTGHLMRYPGDYKGGPRNVINCRCVLMYIGPEDQVLDAVEEKPRYSEDPWVFKEGHSPTYNVDDEYFGLQSRFRQGSNSIPSRLERALSEGRQYGLDHDETAQIYQYTTGKYRDINGKMRDWFYEKVEVPVALKKAALGQRQKIIDGLKKLPAFDGVVQRGVTDNVSTYIEKNGIKVGGTLRAEAYWSTSYDPKAAFDKRLIFVIQSKTGRKIDSLSEYVHEKEVLFVSGTEFNVTKIEEKLGKTYVYMDEISEELKANTTKLDDFVNELQNATKRVSPRFERKISDQNDLASFNNMLIRI